MSAERADPYLISGPALISFSGGRTSAFMLHQILRAHGGALPGDVVVAFANTGKEREETLRFVHECGSRWGVEIVWLERDGESFRRVGLNSASRLGEPFSDLIEKYGYAPHRGAPYCSTELKTRVMKRFALDLGFEHWTNVVGIRRDEGKRYHKIMAANGRERWTTAMPLYDAGATNREVLEFWAEQDFDLGLLGYQGNCDLCWKKGPRKRLRIIRDDPAVCTWWERQEALTNSQFRGDEAVRDARAHVAKSPELPLFDVDDEHDVECGVSCDSEAESAR